MMDGSADEEDISAVHSCAGTFSKYGPSFIWNNNGYCLFFLCLASASVDRAGIV